MDLRALLHAHRCLGHCQLGSARRAAGTLMSQGKSAASSGQHGHGAASLAVDGGNTDQRERCPECCAGYTDCTWGHQQTTHTTHRNSGYNWWRVDLGVTSCATSSA